MDFSKLSPAELIRMCASTDDAEPWNELIKRFTPVVSSAIKRVLVSWGMYTSEVHEELIQDVFLKFWGKPGDHQMLKQMDTSPESKPYGYFQKVAHNLALDYVRAQRAHRRGAGQQVENIDEVHAAAPARAPGSVRDIEWRMEIYRIDAILIHCGFTDRERRIFWQYYGAKGMTCDQIAQQPWVDLSVKGVESLLYRMAKAVREFLDRGGGKGDLPDHSRDPDIT